MTDEPLVLAEPSGPLLYLTLNRPSRANAMNAALLEQFDEALARARTDDSVHVVVVRGAGRGFSAGYDMDKPADAADGRRDPLAEYHHDRSLVERWLSVWEFPKAVIAQVHGYCMGGAVQLAYLCDLTYVAEDTRIQYAAMRAGGGLIPPTWALALGPKRTKEFGFLSASTISGGVAASWGWANRAVPGAELADVVGEVAMRIAAEPPGLIELEKMAINRAFEAAGFRTTLLTGALSNAVGHGSDASAVIHRELQELGPKEFARQREVRIQALLADWREGRGDQA
jgi:enoyl-CoA hydratase